MKPTQDFNVENLLWMKGRKLAATLRSTAPPDRAGWRDLAEDVERRIITGSFRYEGLFSSKSSGKPVLSTSNISDALVLRKINSNIRRAYGIRQTQRANAVKLAKLALGEWTPKGVLGLDLKSCFETIAPGDVLRKLKEDAKVSSQTIVLLEQFFEQSVKFGSNRYKRGLPRGILISSTLAELFLGSVDKEISAIPGVYLHIRYVDDILVLASRPSENIYNQVIQILEKQGLRVNQAKLKMVDVGCKCAFKCAHAIGMCPCKKKCQCRRNDFDNYEFIDYLGYRIIFRTGKDLSKTLPSHALISPKKINKIKSRIELSISDYKITREYELLRDRIVFLTSNVLIDGSQIGTKLRSGIAFTYSEYSEPIGNHPYEQSTLSNIDRFLHTRLRILFKRKGLTYTQKKQLLTRSFALAHANRIRSTFTSERSSVIKACWTSIK